MTRTRRIARWFWPTSRDPHTATLKHIAGTMAIKTCLYLAAATVVFAMWWEASLAWVDRDPHGNMTFNGTTSYCQWLVKDCPIPKP